MIEQHKQNSNTAFMFLGCHYNNNNNSNNNSNNRNAKAYLRAAVAFKRLSHLNNNNNKNNNIKKNDRNTKVFMKAAVAFKSLDLLYNNYNTVTSTTGMLRYTRLQVSVVCTTATRTRRSQKSRQFYSCT